MTFDAQLQGENFPDFARIVELLLCNITVRYFSYRSILKV